MSVLSNEQFKYYGVAIGKKPGIYKTWGQTYKQVNKFPENVYKGYHTLNECLEFMTDDGISKDTIQVFDGRGKGMPLSQYMQS